MSTFKTHLTDPEILQSQEMSHALWGADKSLEERYALLQSRLKYANGGFLTMSGIVDDKGKLITSMKLYYTKLSYHGETLSAVGLGAIFTAEKFRKMGWAKKLIELVLEEARTEGYDCAYLFTDIGAKYYSAFGFHPIPATSFRAPTQSLPSGPGLETRPVTDLDAPLLRKLFEDRWKDTHLHVARDPLYWEFFKGVNPSALQMIFSANGNPVGYYFATPTGEKVWLDEICIDKASETKALASIRSFMEKSHIANLEGWNHPDLLTSVKKETLERKKAAPMMCFLRPVAINIKPEHCYLAGFDHF